MAATNVEVRLILSTTLLDGQIDRMLASAENLIAMYIDPVADERVSAGVRDDIKVWLAAHLCAVSDPRVREESADGVRTVFEGKVDLGLDVTLYGQQVKMMDPTGMLAKIGLGGRKRLVYHFSEPRSETSDP